MKKSAHWQAPYVLIGSALLVALSGCHVNDGDAGLGSVTPCNSDGATNYLCNVGPVSSSSSSSSSGGGGALVIIDNQSANVIVGQTLPSDNGSGNGADQFTDPIGDVVVSDGVLFVSDTSNNRIQAFNPVPTSNDASASFYLDSADGGPQTLVVTDSLEFFGLTSGYDDDIGIAGWDSVPYSHVAYNVQVNAYEGPIGLQAQDMSTAGTKLVVANGPYPWDPISYGGSVLIFNTLPTAGDMGNPSVSITLTDNGSGAGSMSSVSGVWTDGTRLIVSDTGNNQVLVWRTFPVANDTPPSFTLNGVAEMGAAMSSPTNIYSANGQLFVCDTNNNRVLEWDTMPDATNTPPTHVIGQVDFTGTSANQGVTTDINTLDSPQGVYVNNGQLYITDTGNNRILIFNSH